MRELVTLRARPRLSMTSLANDRGCLGALTGSQQLWACLLVFGGCCCQLGSGSEGVFLAVGAVGDSQEHLSLINHPSCLSE